MRYIRTADGKIGKKVGATEIYLDGKFLPADSVQYTEADTIDELCDHLVVIEKGSSALPYLQHRFLGELSLHPSFDRKFQENRLEVYGSIWVDGNLIKVAKMDEKGELKLL